MATKTRKATQATNATTRTIRRRNAPTGDMTDLERRFAVEYLGAAQFNATEAYMRAAGGKVTRETAKANGFRLLQKPEVQALVLAERDRLLGKAELSAEVVLAKLKAFLMYDARRLFDQKTGALLPMERWPEDVATAVIGVKDTIAGREVKLVDKTAALDKAMRYFGLFEKDNKRQAEAIAEVVFKVVKAKPAP